MSTNRSEPAWVDGEPSNLEAAADDALEWLILVERLVDSGEWRLEYFAGFDGRGKLRRARLRLQQMLNGPEDDAKP